MTATYDGKKDGKILVLLRTWVGPTEPGRTGREEVVLLTCDRDQVARPRHIVGTTADGRRMVLSPSVNGFSELTKRFRWIKSPLSSEREQLTATA